VKAREQDDFTPINDVIEAWYRTMLLMPAGGEALAEELQEGFRQIVQGKGGATLDDVRERLRLDVNKRPPRL
jgi:hypothetical protein